MRIRSFLGCVLLILLLVSCSGTTPSVQPFSTGVAQATATFTATLAVSTPQQTPTPLAETPTLAPSATDRPVATAVTEPAVSPTVVEPSTPLPDGASIWVDHQSIALFDQIPDEAIQEAAQLRLMFRHASIGANIDQGLNCLANNFGDRRPNACGDFFDPRYDRSQWVFQFRGNPGWIEKVNDFVAQTHAQADQFDVFTFTLGYVDGLDGSTFPEISDPQNFQTMFIDPLEELETIYPDKIFIWWTMSLARVDHANTQRFNDMLREYAAQRGKILMDIADIESHDPEGNPERSARGYEVIDEHYTNEEQAGHLNETGRDRMARAWWVLMAQIAGWKP